ncbi:MAG: phosphoribosylformylglycinamidine cyclo-ligase [Spirochaetes bacterium]|nr:phosphoribosylformylglycinamidine cyclo-ligase [Spirochaetota bacterium]
MAITYKDSGVNIESGNSFVRKIAPIVKSTFSKNVITDIGGFGALYSGSFPEMKSPILVSGTDGVGTKLKIAQLMNKHDTIGIDAVAMCVNDILTSGARPLFFLDYIACGKIDENVLVDVVKGLADGCKAAGCSLIGGETAEHPDIMAQSDYDIAGFALGVVDKEKIINGSTITKGDVIIGLSSSGIHSNGYSLVRKLLLEIKKFDLNSVLPGLDKPLGEVLLTPTRIYCSSVNSCMDKNINIKGMIHVTGGGFYENIPRILPQNTSAGIDRKSLNLNPVFRIIQEQGEIEDTEMFTTFNMGTGFIMITGKEAADAAVNSLKESGEDARIIGEITKFIDKKVIIS